MLHMSTQELNSHLKRSKGEFILERDRSNRDMGTHIHVHQIACPYMITISRNFILL